MQVEGQQAQQAAAHLSIGVTPVLYPFAAEGSRNSYASYATMKAATRATIRDVREAAVPERLLPLRTVAEELLLASSLQKKVHGVRKEAEHSSMLSDVVEDWSGCEDQASSGIKLGTQLPTQAELMGVEMPVAHDHTSSVVGDGEGTGLADRTKTQCDAGSSAVAATDTLEVGSEQHGNPGPGPCSTSSCIAPPETSSLLQRIAIKTAVLREMVPSTPEQHSEQNMKPGQPPSRPRLQAAVNAALSHTLPSAQAPNASFKANSSSPTFQCALFACVLVCSAQGHQASQEARDQIAASAIECACDPCTHEDPMRVYVNTASRIIAPSGTPDTRASPWSSSGAGHTPTGTRLEIFAAAALKSVIRPAQSITAVHEDTAAPTSTRSAAQLQNSTHETASRDISHVDPLAELDENATNRRDLNACSTWVCAAVAAMVSAAPGRQQEHAWWCTLCCAQRAALPCILHMHCSVHAQNCAAALHVSDAIVRRVCGTEATADSHYDLGGVKVHARKLLEASLCFAWKELQLVSMHERKVVLNHLLGEGTSQGDGDSQVPLRALVSVFEASRRNTTELNAALAAVTNGLSLGESTQGATAVGASVHHNVVSMNQASPVAAVVPALFPALAVAGPRAVFSHMWRLATSQPANAALWAELCCSTAANAGASCSSTAAQAWTAAVRSAAAAQVLAVPAARNATMQCCAEICKSSRSDLQQLKPELHEVLRNGVLHLLRRNSASDPSCILTALGCLQAASTAYKSSLLHSLSRKDCVDLLCAVCACSAGRWGWHSNPGISSSAEVSLDLLQAQADASTVLQTLRDALPSVPASSDVQDILEACEAAARFHARYRQHAPVGDGIGASTPMLRYASLCPQVHISLSALVKMLGLQAYRLRCKHLSDTLQMMAAARPHDTAASKQLHSSKVALQKAMKILYALHADLEEASIERRSSVQEWYSTLTGAAGPQRSTLAATQPDAEAHNETCSHGNTPGKVQEQEVSLDKSAAAATDDDRRAASSVSGRPAQELVNRAASFLGLCAVPMSEQQAQQPLQGGPMAPSAALTAFQRPAQEQELAASLRACLECTLQSSKPAKSNSSAAEAPVATAAALTGTVALLLPEFPAKRSEELLLALAALRQRYLPSQIACSLCASSDHHSTFHSFALLSGAASQAAAGIVALVQRAAAARACMCLLRAGHASQPPAHGWPQRWLELAEVSTGTRAVGAALKVLCGVFMAAVKVMGTMHDGNSVPPKHSLVIGTSDSENPCKQPAAVYDSVAADNAAASALLCRRMVSQGSIIRIFSETCSEVVSGPLAGHVDTAAAKQTLAKLLEGFQKLLADLVALLKRENRWEVDSDSKAEAGNSATLRATSSYGLLMKHIVESVVTCTSKLPAEFLDEGACEGLQAWIEDELELDGHVVVGAEHDVETDLDSD